MHVCELRACQCGAMASTATRLTPSSRPSSLPPPADRPPGDGPRHAVPGQHHLALGPAGRQQAPCQHQVRDHHILRPDSHSRPSAPPCIFLCPCIRFSIYLSHSHIYTCEPRAFSLWWYSIPQGCLLLHPPLPCPATQTNLLPAMTNTPAAPPCLPNTPWQPPSPVAATANGGALERMILDWSHFTVAPLSQPNCLFLLILLFLTTCICLQIPDSSQRLHLYYSSSFKPFFFFNWFSTGKTGMLIFSIALSRLHTG